MLLIGRSAGVSLTDLDEIQGPPVAGPQTFLQLRKTLDIRAQRLNLRPEGL
jgi:hypothetical protein